MIVDQYKVIDTYPGHSQLTTVREVSFEPGGLLCNCAVDLARLDPDLHVPVVGVIGRDTQGAFLLDRLGEYPQIDTSQVHYGADTSFTDVMEDRAANTRTFFQYRGANAELDLDHVDFDRLDVDAIHVGYALLLDRLDSPDEEYGTRLARLLATAKERGLRTSIDVVSEDSDRFERVVTPALAHTDVLVVNEYEAGRISGNPVPAEGPSISWLRETTRRLLDAGVGEWVVIHWAGGGAGRSKDGQWEIRPSLALDPSKIATTTGAGDAFASGIVWAGWAGWDLGEALELAIGAAACSLREANATSGVRPVAETLAEYRAAGKVALPEED